MHLGACEGQARRVVGVSMSFPTSKVQAAAIPRAGACAASTALDSIR